MVGWGGGWHSRTDFSRFAEIFHIRGVEGEDGEEACMDVSDCPDSTGPNCGWDCHLEVSRALKATVRRPS